MSSCISGKFPVTEWYSERKHYDFKNPDKPRGIGKKIKETRKSDRCNHHRNTQYNQCFSRSLHASGVEEHARNGFRLRKVAQWVLVLLLQLLPCRKLRGREDRQRRTTGGQRDRLENIVRCLNEYQAADFLADQVKRKSIGGSRRQSQAEDVISGGICPYWRHKRFISTS